MERKQGPRSKKTNTNLPRCQRKLYFNVKNSPIACSSSKGSLCYWMEWKHCSSTGRAPPVPGGLLSAAPCKLRAVLAPWETRCRQKGDSRAPSSGCPMVLTGVWVALWTADSCMGRVLKWEFSSDRFLSCNSFWGRVFNIFFLFWPWW